LYTRNQSEIGRIDGVLRTKENQKKPGARKKIKEAVGGNRTPGTKVTLGGLVECSARKIEEVGRWVGSVLRTKEDQKKPSGGIARPEPKWTPSREGWWSAPHERKSKEARRMKEDQRSRRGGIVHPEPKWNREDWWCAPHEKQKKSLGWWRAPHRRWGKRGGGHTPEIKWTPSGDWGRAPHEKNQKESLGWRRSRIKEDQKKSLTHFGEKGETRGSEHSNEVQASGWSVSKTKVLARSSFWLQREDWRRRSHKSISNMTLVDAL
jgi:hypothetical protein